MKVLKIGVFFFSLFFQLIDTLYSDTLDQLDEERDTFPHIKTKTNKQTNKKIKLDNINVVMHLMTDRR